VRACGRASVLYPVDGWAEAPSWLAELGYGLCVSSSLEAAWELMFALGEGEIWEALGEDEMPLPEAMLALEDLAGGQVFCFP
jgi:hypothetical protein